MKRLIMRWLLIIILLATTYVSSSFGSSLITDPIEDMSVNLVITVDTIKDSVYTSSGLLLWNYSSSDSLYLLLARHSVNGRHKLKIGLESRDGSLKTFPDTHFELYDSTGEPIFLSFQDKKGMYADIALYPLQRKAIPRAIVDTALVLSRSYCVFNDGLFLGDKILMCGFADRRLFNFVDKGKFLVTSGTLSFKGEDRFLVDKKAFHGMSGGIVFKEYPNFDKIGYKAAGIVVAEYGKKMNYTWIVKLGYIDSILISNTGAYWGATK